MYDFIIKAFYDIIASPSWSTQVGLTTIPYDHRGSINAKTFAKVKVTMPKVSRPSFGENKTVSGLFLVSIYSNEYEGQLWVTSYTTRLDSILQDKTIANQIQTGLSSLQSMGLDSSDSTLTRHDYSVPFTYYGGTT